MIGPFSTAAGMTNTKAMNKLRRCPLTARTANTMTRVSSAPSSTTRPAGKSSTNGAETNRRISATRNLTAE